MIVFFFACIFVIYGVWGECFNNMIHSGMDVAHCIKKGDFGTAYMVMNMVETNTIKKQNYHDRLLDINSLKENILGTRVIMKEDTIVAKSDEGFLLGYFDDELDDSLAIDEWLAAIRKNQQLAEKNGAHYLYCAVPAKTFYFREPLNVTSYNKINYDNKINILSDSDIPFIDFYDVFEEKHVSKEDMFFITDHHWKPQSGFLANKIISEKLSDLYGFNYNKKATDLDNYIITTYPNWFLGSYGKKAGTFFTWYGADDFDLITPKFETDFTENIASNGTVRKGRFEETVLHMKKMKKDYYHVFPYSTYSGGDFRLQIIRNNLIPEGKKILILRNSFSCVITPFLALQAGELHIIDDREGDYPSGEKVNIENYIVTEKPDYVIEVK